MSPINRIQFFVSLAVSVLLFAGCSTKKNTAFGRFWHRTNTHYNGWFNGNEAIKYGMQELTKTRRDDFTRIIPVFDYGDRSNWSNMNTNSDRAIKKAVVMIKKHSMLINGKQYNKWIDDCYLLLGIAHYFKQEFDMGVGQLRYVSENSEKTGTREYAKIWMMRTYSEMGESPDAATVHRKIEQGNINSKQLWEYHATVADFHIRNKDWEKALDALDRAISTVKRKKRKARFAFIKGQIYQQIYQPNDAYNAYASVLKYKPEYELEFQAKISMAKTSDNQSTEDLRKLLKRMLRDGKNIDYLDQIYYAIALIDLKENKRDDAIVNLKKSLSNSAGNDNQKALSYLKLAELYLADRKYEPAQAYYDSTTVFLRKDHPQYDEVMKLKENLTEVVLNIRIVELQDSLQRLGRLSEPDLIAFLEDYVEDLKEKDIRNKEQEQNKTYEDPKYGGTWPWTNSQLLALGMQDFRKTWGQRPLEDDWRRTDKTSNAFNAFADPDTVDEKIEPRYDIQTYLVEIPRTDSAFAASNEMIYSALYNLGLVYKEKINDFPKSVEAFEELVKRNTQNQYFPVTYYQLFLVNNMMKDDANASKYKDIILRDYPSSEYAQLLTNPGYSQVLDEQNDQAEPAYREAYHQYSAGAYEACLSTCNNSMAEYPQSKLKHRFALLVALCIGETRPQEEFVASLKAVSADYSGSESAHTADRLLKLLNQSGGVQDEGDNSLAVETSPFTYDPAAEHLFIFLVEDPAKKLDGAVAEIANFSEAHFPGQNLSVNNILMASKFQVWMVSKFPDAKAGMKYHKEFLTNDIAGKLKLGNTKYYQYVISVANYAVLFKKGNVSEYDSFFKKNYVAAQ